MSKAAWRSLVELCLTNCNQLTVEPGWEPPRDQPREALRELIDASVRDAVQSDGLPERVRDAKQITLVLPREPDALGADLLEALLDLLGSWSEASVRALVVTTASLAPAQRALPAHVEVLRERGIPWLAPKPHVHRPPSALAPLRAPLGDEPVPLAFHPWLLDTDINLLVGRVRHDPLLGVSTGWAPLVLGGGSPRVVQALLSPQVRTGLCAGAELASHPLGRALRRAGRMLAPSFAVLECADGEARAIASGDPGAVAALLQGLSESPIYRITEEVDALVVLLDAMEATTPFGAVATGLLAVRHPRSALAPGAPLVIVAPDALAAAATPLAPSEAPCAANPEAPEAPSTGRPAWTLEEADLAVLMRAAARPIHLVWPGRDDVAPLPGVAFHTSLSAVLRQLELDGHPDGGAPLEGVLLTRGVSHILPLTRERRSDPETRPPLRGDT